MAIPTYTVIPDTDINVGAPTKSPTAFALRDNVLSIAQWDTTRSGRPVICAGSFDPLAINTADINDNAVTAGKISGAFGQAQVKSATGTGSGTAVVRSDTYPIGTQIALPGGAYGFWPSCSFHQPSGGDFGTLAVGGGVYSGGAVYDANLSAAADDGTGGLNFYFSQLYIIASPPYDLGDGEIPLFVYAELDPSGKIVSTWSAPTPPWAYRGSHRIESTHIVNGKPMRKQLVMPNGFSSLSFQEKAAAIRSAKTEEVEVTAADKLLNMPATPHPFITSDKINTIVLLDPPSTADLLTLHTSGQDITQLLRDGNIIIDNNELQRHAPPGVRPVSWKWKP